MLFSQAACRDRDPATDQLPPRPLLDSVWMPPQSCRAYILMWHFGHGQKRTTCICVSLISTVYPAVTSHSEVGPKNLLPGQIKRQTSLTFSLCPGLSRCEETQSAVFSCCPELLHVFPATVEHTRSSGCFHIGHGNDQHSVAQLGARVTQCC